jgi:DNA-binding NarL/FixJ family response regulator
MTETKTRRVSLRISDELVDLALRSVLIESEYIVIDDENNDEDAGCVLITDDLAEVNERSVLVVDQTSMGAKSALDLMQAGQLQCAIPRDRPRDLPLAIEVLQSGFTGTPIVLQERAAEAPDLRDREIAVLGLLVDGASNADIARKLNVSQASVKRYVAALMELFGVESRVDLAQQAIRSGFDNLRYERAAYGTVQ